MATLGTQNRWRLSPLFSLTTATITSGSTTEVTTIVNGKPLRSVSITPSADPAGTPHTVAVNERDVTFNLTTTNPFDLNLEHFRQGSDSPNYIYRLFLKAGGANSSFAIVGNI